MSGAAAKVAVRKVLGWLKPKNISLFDSIYKTAYASFDYIGDANILKFMKTSAVTDDLKSTGAEPIEVTNGIGGINGLLLTHSEVHGIPCILFMSVIDSYEFTSETFGSYEGAISASGLNSHIAKTSDLTKRGEYKSILKRYNQKKHNIYNLSLIHI